MTTPRYVGFWQRAFASVVDSVLFTVLLGAIFVAFYGWDSSLDWRYVDGDLANNSLGDFLLSWLLPAVLTILFWEYKAATPGKMVISAKIVDAETGQPPTPAQWIIRYLGYFVSLIPLGLGFLWIAFDARKQGWHDKLAGTVVTVRAGGSEGSRLQQTHHQQESTSAGRLPPAQMGLESGTGYGEDQRPPG